MDMLGPLGEVLCSLLIVHDCCYDRENVIVLISSLVIPSIMPTNGGSLDKTLLGCWTYGHCDMDILIFCLCKNLSPLISLPLSFPRASITIEYS